MNASTTPARGSRVMHVITHVGLGGAERVALDLVGGLGQEFAFSLFAVHGVDKGDLGRTWSEELLRSGVPLRTGSRIPLKSGGLPLVVRRLGQAMAELRPQIVHLHTEIPEASYSALLAWRAPTHRPAIVRTIHNSHYWHHWSAFGRWCERRLTGSHVACVSHDALEAFARFHASAGTAALRTSPVGGRTVRVPRVIYNGVPEPEAAAAPRTGRKSTLRVLFAGRFDPQKGADLLPEIVRATQVPGARCELFVHGEGECEPLLKKLSASPPEGWTVHVEKPVAGLRERLRDFDLVVVPSRFEGAPLVPIEAVLAGVPVVVTDAPGLRETVPADYPWRAAAGDARAFAEALSRAMGEQERWTAAVSVAQSFARERFSPARMFAGYRELYAEAEA